MPLKPGTRTQWSRTYITTVSIGLLLLSLEFFSPVRAKKNQPKNEAINQSNSEAQQAINRATELQANWDKTSLLAAIDQYEKAAAIWVSASDFKNASQATLQSGDIYYLFSSYSDALKRYQSAEALAEKSRDWLATANALSRVGRAQSSMGNNDAAQQQLNKAIDLFKQHEPNQTDAVANHYSEALTNLAEVNYSKGDFIAAREQLKRALELLRGDLRIEAKIHLYNAYITGSLGDPEKAAAELSQSLELSRKANDKIGESRALTTMGLSYSVKRDVTHANELHGQAIKIFRAVGDRYHEAVALNGMGQSYEVVNEYELAKTEYEQALRLFEEINSPDGVAVATFELANITRLSGHPDEAVALYERCLRVSHAAKNTRVEANALNEISKIYAAQGRHEQASQQYQKLAKFYESIGDFRGQANAMNAHADLLLQLGHKENALEVCQQALPASEKAGDKGILITTLYNLARVNLALGSPDAALSSIRRSLNIIEDLRANVASPDFRVSYLSEVRKHYDLGIEVLMKLESQNPGHGFAAEALLVSERGRARLLLDLVNESRSSVRQGAAQPLLDRQRELRGLFRAQAQYRMDLVSNKKDAAEIAAVDRQLDQLRAEYQQIEAELRQRNNHLSTLEQSASLNLQQIQDQLKNDDTMLLEYALGDEHSHLWTVTAGSFRFYELPARKVIEDAARDLYETITARQEGDGTASPKYQQNVEAADNAYFDKAGKLSQILLGQVADQLGTRRLVVITEGALQHIPLDALPLPMSQAAPTSRTLLVERNEVVALPSISTLLAIRSGRDRSNSANKLVAVIADPVLSAADERVKNSRNNSVATSVNKIQTRSADDQTRGAEFARLPYASEEADAIASEAPWGSKLIVKGFDANRETVLNSNLGQYQIVHFATHGYLNNERPELSGIVLSSVDRNGNLTDGFLALHDIDSLGLSSELTVLSACQTALGKDIRGEGLVGLTHSFLSAGSSTVVASLWKVDDRATAVLMASFYDAMLQQGMAPSAALRAAKLKLMQQKGWSAPYYWAGFVLQGEYTNHITVARHPWLRVRYVVLSLFLLLAIILLFIKSRKRPS